MRTTDAEFLQRIRAAFAVEAREHLQVLAAGLLAMERQLPDLDVAQLETVFRHTHSLKGAARAASFGHVESACQALEAVFALGMRRRLRPSPEDFDLLQRAVDVIGELVAAGAQPPPAELRGRLQALLRQLEALQERRPAGSTVPGARPPSVLDASTSHASTSTSTSTASASVPAAAPGQNETASGEDTAARASPESSRTAPAGDPVRPGTAPDIAPAAAAATSVPTTRVATPDLDRLLRSVEEMLAWRQGGAERARRLAETSQVLSAWHQEWRAVQPSLRQLRREAANAPDSPAVRVVAFVDATFGSMKRLEERLGALSRSSARDRDTMDRQVADLLGQSRDLLLTPFASLAELMPKVVRDLARSQGKRVDLEVAGGDVRVDKRLLDQMKDPLIHLLRNAVDHGIASPAERERAGRPAAGTVRLSARYAGGDKIEFVVEDDGTGLDAEAVRQAAVRCGVVDAPLARRLDDTQAVDLVFRSQVTTRPAAGEVSGRGLGLAIVREEVESLGGQVTVANGGTDRGKDRGARFTITLPQSLGALRGVFVRAGDQAFVLPSLHVDGVARVPRADIATVRNQPTVTRRGRVVPLAALGDVLRLPGDHGASQEECLHVVFVEAGPDALALAVDEVLDDGEVLVKRLEPPLLRVRNIAGATIDATGKVIPLLNVADLVKSTRSMRTRPRAPVAATTRPQAPRARILLAEDSITSRLLLKGILESAGCDVATCADGIEAFTALRSERFDLLVSDVEMPRLNGFDLTARVRADPVLAELPVVLVTALARREDRERGMDVGASAYIAKGSFDQRELVDAVRRLLDLRGAA